MSRGWGMSDSNLDVGRESEELGSDMDMSDFVATTTTTRSVGVTFMSG